MKLFKIELKNKTPFICTQAYKNEYLLTLSTGDYCTTKVTPYVGAMPEEVRHGFIVKDWTGSRVYGEAIFLSFEDAWEKLYLDNPNDEDLSDFFVDAV